PKIVSARRRNQHAGRVRYPGVVHFAEHDADIDAAESASTPAARSDCIGALGIRWSLRRGNLAAKLGRAYFRRAGARHSKCTHTIREFVEEAFRTVG
ncbi:MAG: hypothetical protein M3R59_10715, partial [Verrucomicrobiota bacterium]|nr:hypothetical protein [Verrucomicrobiota bacterium]